MFEFLVESSYFTNEGFHEPLLGRLPSLLSEAGARQLRELAFVLIKPDAFVAGKAAAVLAWLTGGGFEVAFSLPYLRPRLGDFEQLYLYNLSIANPLNMAGNWWINSQVYLEGASLALLLHRAKADGGSIHQYLAACKGPSDPRMATRGTLRGDLGAANRSLNLVHAADDPLSTFRELAIFTGGEEAAAEVIETVRSRGAAQAGGTGVVGEDLRLDVHLCREERQSFARICAKLKAQCARLWLPEGWVGKRELMRQYLAVLECETDPEVALGSLLSVEEDALFGVGASDPRLGLYRRLSRRVLMSPDEGAELVDALCGTMRISSWERQLFLTGLLHWDVKEDSERRVGESVSS